MNVKSISLNGYIAEEVYIKQPFRFENHACLNYVYKLYKILYGLKQAPHTWYER